jgi:DNA-binding NarL/FixJ family response regulator
MASIEAAEALSDAPEARIGALVARAALEYRQGRTETAVSRAEEALRAVEASRVIEVFVSAYRGWPDLTLLLFGNPSNHKALTELLGRAGDAGLAAASQSRSVLDLTRREKEVLSLIAQGLSNREIATRLYISPTTAKVHVHHIFEKLGVKSRAEAALRGAQLGRQATATDASTPS